MQSILNQIKSGNYVKALSLLDELGEASTDSLYNRLLCYYGQNQPQKVLETFKAACPQLHSLETYNIVAATCYMLGNLTKAMELWEHICSSENPLVESAIAYAPVLFEKGDYKRTVEVATLAINLPEFNNLPEQRKYYTILTLAGAFFNAGQTMAAFQQLQGLKETYPNRPQASLQLCVFYSMCGKHQEAYQEVCDAIAEKQPGDFNESELFNIYRILSSSFDERTQDFKPKGYNSVPISTLAGSIIYELPHANNTIVQQNLDKWVQDSRKLSGHKRLTFSKGKDTPFSAAILTGDARTHSVGHLLRPFMTALKTTYAKFTIYSCYEPNYYDPLLEWYKKNTNYIYVGGKSADEIVELMQQNDTRIVIDASGHTANNRMDVLLQVDVPIINYLGFPYESRIPNSFFPQDNYCKVPKTWNCKPMILPSIYYLNLPPIKNHNYPVLEQGFFTFGSLAAPYKITEKTLDIWAQILKENPSSKFYYARPELSSPSLYANFQKKFNDRGIGNDQLILANNPVTKHWQHYYKIDCIIDTFDLSGGLNTIDAARMHIPTLNIKSDNYCGNLSASICNQLMYNSFQCKDELELRQLASSICNNTDDYLTLRQGNVMVTTDTKLSKQHWINEFYNRLKEIA